MQSSPAAQNPILFRVDASRAIGLGHVMRCLAYAQGLRKKYGIPSIFVLRRKDSIARRLIHRRGFEVRTIPVRSASARDSGETARIARHAGAKILITDLSHARHRSHWRRLAGYLRELSIQKLFLIVIDGWGPDCMSLNVKVPAQLLIIPYFPPVSRRLIRAERRTTLLSGPDYFIFRPEFETLRRFSKPIPPLAQRILITMGGSDPYGLTEKVAAAFQDLAEYPLHARFVIGADYGRKRALKLKNLLQKLPFKSDICADPWNMAEQMAWSDLILTSSGLSRYEAALTRTPCAVITHDGSGQALSRQFAKAHTALDLGRIDRISPADLSQKLAALIRDRQVRRKIRDACGRLVDRGGLSRIFAQIPREVLS